MSAAALLLMTPVGRVDATPTLPSRPGLVLIGWGNDDKGQASPLAVPAGTTVVDVAAGGSFSLALLSDGTIMSWGTAPEMPASLTRKRVVAIGAGDGDAIALTDDHTVTTWGPRTSTSGPGTLAVPAQLAGQPVQAVSLGAEHALALTSSGTVVAWGDDSYNQTDVPASLTGTTVVAISAGLRHSLALTSDGHVVGWGNSFIGEISGPPSGTYAAISAGGGFSTAITSAGKLVSWYDGGAGDNDVPAALATTSFTAVSAGHSRTLALAKDGTLYSWGTATPTDPVAVPASLAGRTVTALSASENDTSLVATLGHFTAGVTVSGTRVVGHRLHATVGPTPEGTTVALQWLRNGSAIPGSTGTTYLLRVADARTHLVARATLTKPMYDVGHPASTATPAIRLPALTLRVTCDPTSVHRHRTFTVGTAGLVAGEAYHLTLGGRSLASGHATSRGRVTRRLTMPGTAPLGVRRLTVTGSQADRTGSRSVRVLPRG